MSNDKDGEEFKLSEDLTQRIVDSLPLEEFPRDAVEYYQQSFGELDNSVKAHQKGLSYNIMSELIELSRLAYHKGEGEVVVARDFMHDEFYSELCGFKKEIYAELLGYARKMHGREIRNIGRLEVKVGVITITNMPKPPEVPDLDELGDEGWTIFE